MSDVNGNQHPFLSFLWSPGLAFGVLLLLLWGCSGGAEQEVGQIASGPAPQPWLASHEYDPISDAVVSWTLAAGERVGQSFRVEGKGESLRAFRIKLVRFGTPPPLRYRIGTAWGRSEFGSGKIPAERVSLFFERWIGVDFPSPRSLSAGNRYVLQLEVEEGDGEGHYELFGTASEALPASNFHRRYQYLPTWGEVPEEEPELENPMNLDYGAKTPRYAGGSALDPQGRPLEALDFAFQISGISPPPREEAELEERFAFVEDQLLSPVHTARPAAQVEPRAPGEVEITSEWTLLLPPGATPLIESAAADFADFLQTGWSLSLSRRQASPAELDAPASPSLVVATRHQLPQAARSLTRSQSFLLEVSEGRIVLCGYDERGVQRGLYYLEDLFSLRGAPGLARGRQERFPLYSPRITTAPFYSTQELDLSIAPFTDPLLSRISHYGFDGIWVWGDLVDVGRSPVFPELDQGVRRRQRKLGEITARAAGHGIDVYLMLIYRPLPAPFFERHPEVRGSPFRAHGGDYVLCTSTELVQQFIREATRDLLEQVPDLKGILFIVGGEGFIHCYTRRIDCPRCSRRSPQEVVAELAGILAEGARSARPDTPVVLWPYSASHWWSKGDIPQARLIERLPQGVTFLTEFAKEGLITFDAVTVPAYDYPISYLGPSQRFTQQARLTAEKGLPLWVKTEHAIALEMVQTPFIPVFFRWGERFHRIRQFPQVSGVLANWMHYGFMPTLAPELFKWHSWSPPPDTGELLRRMARRDFGPGTEEAALRAWRQWSDAISHYPFSGPMAMGPIQKGPAHPLFLDPGYRPAHHYGRQFKNDLSWTAPWGADLALAQLDKLEQAWERGVKSWQEVVERASPSLRGNARRHEGVGRALLACIRSARNVGRFYQLRDRLWKETDPHQALSLLDQLETLAEQERANAREILPFIARDSRLGYANSGGSSQTGVPRGGIYSPRSIEKKIEQVNRLLQEELPEYRKRLR